MIKTTEDAFIFANKLRQTDANIAQEISMNISELTATCDLIDTNNEHLAKYFADIQVSMRAQFNRLMEEAFQNMLYAIQSHNQAIQDRIVPTMKRMDMQRDLFEEKPDAMQTPTGRKWSDPNMQYIRDHYRG